ncbi:YjbF family lipoprotein [Pseudomonas vancouverensis]|uniref:YjbF family lipoprotein n=1 Tax=Pseudomonas vancouverensis TaxID=95300 RepID=A0A1H2MPC2_PSEVA|nr:YjbF family lipoprotein [Pseudomonas vancouverensis]KAB0494591.1 YjbF family lipoprotein [Pseudomonas vancouverensis]TDB59257.1 YjbF family lipoprotein [Pseudomonas vancouverensis]SDU95100.1 Group 4 capsule polysaccharide lipoprotein gfcB, YjbF [Pseudomonas vancouverensis]
MKLLRLATLSVASLLVSACNPLMTASMDTLKAAFEGPEPLKLTRQQVDATPYYQITITAPTGEAVMALVRQQGDVGFWMASTRQILMLEDGLAIRSVGFNDNLDGTRFEGASPFKTGLNRIPDGLQTRRQVDFVDGYRMGVSVTSRFNKKGLETVHILDRDVELLRVDEDISMDGLGFSARNRYWVDPVDGFIMASEQYLTPELPLRIVQVRPNKPVVQ